MRAVVITRIGGPEVFEVHERPEPEPSGDQVRVRVRASGLNRADLQQAQGQYPAPPGVPDEIPGLEFAGEIDAVGPGVTGPLKVGDRVFGIVAGGGLAEWVVSPERMVVAIPSRLHFEQAAGVPEVFITAHDALDARARLKSGERVLIHAVAGGVGSAACQIAHAMGCTVFGTSRTGEKLRKVEDFGLGIDVAIDTSCENLAEVVRRETIDKGVDAVIDHIGGPALAANLEVLTTGGRLVLVGLLGGSITTIDLKTVLRKRITIVGTALRARPIEEKIAATQAFANRVVPWLDQGIVRPVIDRVYPVGQVVEAYERLKSNLGLGKVVLSF